MSLKSILSVFLLCLAVFGLSVNGEEQTAAVTATPVVHTVESGQTLQIGGDQQIQIKLKQPEGESGNPEANTYYDYYDSTFVICSYCNNDCSDVPECQEFTFDPYTPLCTTITTCSSYTFSFQVTSWYNGVMQIAFYTDPTCSYPTGNTETWNCGFCQSGGPIAVQCPSYSNPPRHFSICGTCDEHDTYCEKSDTCERFDYVQNNCYRITNPCTGDFVSRIRPYYWDGQIMQYYQWTTDVPCEGFHTDMSQLNCQDCQQPAGINIVCSPASSLLPTGSLFSAVLSLVAAAIFGRKIIA